MKLRTKLTLAISLLVLVVVMAANIYFLQSEVREQMDEVGEHAESMATELQQQIGEEWNRARLAGVVSGDDASLQRFFSRLTADDAMQQSIDSLIGDPLYAAMRDVALTDPDGKVVLDSNPALVGTRLSGRSPLQPLIAGGTLRQFEAIRGRDQILEYTMPLQVGDRPLGSIAVGVDTVLLNRTLVAKFQSLAWTGLLIVLGATLLATVLSGIVLTPLSAISAQLDRLMGTGSSEPAAAPEPGLPPITGPPGAVDGSLARADEYGVVSSKIRRLGMQMEDVRNVYTTLQENVAHVLESLEEGLLLFDAGGQCVMASAAAPRLLGLHAGEIVGKNVDILFPDSGTPQAQDLDGTVRRAIRERRPLSSCELRRVAESRPLLVRLDAVRDRDGLVGWLLTVRDAEPVRRLENELELARRLSAVGRLTRGVAHEVKNPLNAMAIHLELLSDKTRGDRSAAGLHPHIDVLRREIDRLDRVVKTFLDFSRPVELQLMPTDLSEIARGVGRLVQAGADEKGITLEVQAPQPGPRSWVDRDLVEQALLNLVNNGLQAMAESPNGGKRLWLEVVNVAEGESAVRVRDQGPGIPPEIRDRIFDLYFTTRAEGTGIGLALASRIMQLHNGSLELETTEAPGASFLLRFPMLASGGPATS